MRLIRSNTVGHLIFHSEAFGTYGFSLENEFTHDWDIVSVDRYLYKVAYGYSRL